MLLLLPFILKIIIYSLWCYVAIRYLPHKDQKIHYPDKSKSVFKSALKFGVIRFIIGLIIGAPLWYLGINLLAYLLSLIFIHFINWCIMLRIISGQLLLKRKEIRWVVGGTFISCLMDVMLISSFIAGGWGR